MYRKIWCDRYCSTFWVCFLGWEELNEALVRAGAAATGESRAAATGACACHQPGTDCISWQPGTASPKGRTETWPRGKGLAGEPVRNGARRRDRRDTLRATTVESIDRPTDPMRATASPNVTLKWQAWQEWMDDQLITWSGSGGWWTKKAGHWMAGFLNRHLV
jgi:hypothetical protein